MLKLLSVSPRERRSDMEAPESNTAPSTSEPPIRIIRRHRTALTHGLVEEQREAAAAFARLASAGRAACEALLQELIQQFVRTLNEPEADPKVVASTLFTVELMAVHFPEVSEHAVSAPIIARLDSADAIVSSRAKSLLHFCKPTCNSL